MEKDKKTVRLRDAESEEIFEIPPREDSEVKQSFRPSSVGDFAIHSSGRDFAIHSSGNSGIIRKTNTEFM